jgi:hypothetical protein
MIRRRLRGILRTTIAVCIPWTAIGLVIGVLLQPHGFGEAMAFGHVVPGGVTGAFTIAGALVGIVNGLTFSFLVLAAERGKRVEQLRGWRWAAWGALAAGTRWAPDAESHHWRHRRRDRGSRCNRHPVDRSSIRGACFARAGHRLTICRLPIA